MVKKEATKFVCLNCGAISSSWSGRCFNCGEWNTIQEEVDVLVTSSRSGNTLDIISVNKGLKTDQPRLKSKIADFDSVLGGGVVAGSVMLLAGQPGIGKSTLLLQIAEAISKHVPVLYISGEESAHQVAMRAKRLRVSSGGLQLATSNSTDDIAKTINENAYALVIVDSIQAIKCADVSSAAGSVSQITNSTNLLTNVAKAKNCALILVGHVTKEGSIAGPKLLEHMVDVVLNLEGDRYGGFKLLRAIKNRYGSTTETGIFEITDIGFKEVDNPSAALLAERQVSDGSIVLATMEGSRPLLVEVQALVNKTSYGYPKRTASGIDLNRLNLLIAMLEKRTKLQLVDNDIYINIVGGIKINETAADLAVCMAIASAAKGMQLKNDAVVFGEVGLSGEIRHVPYLEKRIKEANKLGFKMSIGPKITPNIKGHYSVKDIKSALNTFLSKE